MAKNLEIRALGNCEVRADEGQREISGYIIKWDTVDSHNTTFIRGCCKKTIRENQGNIKVLWNHDHKGFPIGTLTEIAEDDVGVFFRAKLAETETGSEAYELVKIGAINTMSFGFRLIKDGGYKKGVRQITEIALMEISPVNFPSNPAATIDDVRATNFTETVKEADLRVRGSRLMQALEETIWDIFWMMDEADEQVRAADQAIGEFHTAFIEWMQEIQESRAEDGLRGAPDANALALAFNEALSGRSVADFAANSTLTLTQCQSLRKGQLLTEGADLGALPEQVRKAYEERQAEVAQALHAELEALPEELRNQALEGFAVNVESKETPEPEPQHDERAQALQELLERVRASRKS